MTIPVGVLISGRGSNMLTLIEAAKAPGYPAEIVLTLSDQPEAPGLAAAEAKGVPARAIPRADYPDRAAHEAAMHAALTAAGVEMVCLAGYMRVLSPAFVDQWLGRLLNIHPSLLPAYKGLDTHARVLAAGEQRHGCTVHLVSAEVDGGRILGQAEVPILPDDDAETLAARVLAEEHRLYPKILKQWIEQRA